MPYFLIFTVQILFFVFTANANQNFCSQTATSLVRACFYDAQNERHLSQANCINYSDDEERSECFIELYDDFIDNRKECASQYKARKSICQDVGEGRYEPDFSPENFVDPLMVGSLINPNPYLPLIVGSEWIYEGDGEIIIVTVTNKIKLIDGVKCLVVNDVVLDEDGQLIEDTDDWFAQDVNGNVWYCGEISKNYEVFEGDEPEEAELVDIDGSFKVGREGAKAGILFKANPIIGEVLRQEVALEEAEDMAKTISLSASAVSPAAECVNTCLETSEYTPLEPGVYEQKFYLPGIGFILEIDAEGNRVELVEYRIGE